MSNPPALLRATTRTLPATETNGTRIKVTLDTGETATFPHDYTGQGDTAAVNYALKLARNTHYGTADIEYKITGHTASGYAIAIWPAKENA